MPLFSKVQMTLFLPIFFNNSFIVFHPLFPRSREVVSVISTSLKSPQQDIKIIIDITFPFYFKMIRNLQKHLKQDRVIL